MWILSKVVSAEPGTAPHCARTSLHDLNMLFNHISKSQVTQCSCNKDIKKSVHLRDISSVTHIGIERPLCHVTHPAEWEVPRVCRRRGSRRRQPPSPEDDENEPSAPMWTALPPSWPLYPSLLFVPMPPPPHNIYSASACSSASNPPASTHIHFTPARLTRMPQLTSARLVLPKRSKNRLRDTSWQKFCNSPRFGVCCPAFLQHVYFTFCSNSGTVVI